MNGLEGDVEVSASKIVEDKDERAEKLAQIFRGAGIEAKAMPLREGGISIKEAVIVPRKEGLPEDRVRVYRGISRSDESVLRQSAYGLRGIDPETGSGSRVLEEVRKDVEALANSPTYTNLLNYAREVRPLLNSDLEREKLDAQLEDVENGVLEGVSLRWVLMNQQIQFNGGNLPDTGIAPYIAASWDAKQAFGYARFDEALMVLDLPASKVANFAVSSGELSIKGAIDKSYITAVIFRDKKTPRDNPNFGRDLRAAIEEVSVAANAPMPDASVEERLKQREADLAHVRDVAEGPLDLEMVRQKRALDIIDKFPEVGLKLEDIELDLSREYADIYALAKRKVYDYFAKRFSQIGRGGRRIESYDYEPKYSSGNRKHYREDEVSDEMLRHMKDQVERSERLEIERQSYN